MNSSFRSQLLVGASVLASLVLVGAYLAAGGSSYTPKQTQDPCKQRQWTDPGTLQEIAQQFSLSAADGAACELGVSREELIRALPSEDARQRFLDEYDIGADEFARAIRAGLLRAIDDAEEAGALSPFLAAPLRQAIAAIPLDRAIELVNDARSLFEGGGSIVGLGETGLGILEGFLPE